MHGHKTEQFIKMLSPEYRKVFSYVIDEIERLTYWETRQDILSILKRKKEEGQLEEHLDYMINKSKPGE